MENWKWSLFFPTEEELSYVNFSVTVNKNLTASWSWGLNHRHPGRNFKVISCISCWLWKGRLFHVYKEGVKINSQKPNSNGRKIFILGEKSAIFVFILHVQNCCIGMFEDVRATMQDIYCMRHGCVIFSQDDWIRRFPWVANFEVISIFHCNVAVQWWSHLHFSLNQRRTKHRSYPATSSRSARSARSSSPRRTSFSTSITLFATAAGINLEFLFQISYYMSLTTCWGLELWTRRWSIFLLRKFRDISGPRFSRQLCMPLSVRVRCFQLAFFQSENENFCKPLVVIDWWNCLLKQVYSQMKLGFENVIRQWDWNSKEISCISSWL